MDVTALLDNSGVTEADLVAGIYDYSKIFIFIVNWADLSQGILKGRRGWLGEITIDRSSFKAEVRGMMQQLQQTIGKLYSLTCRAELGDTECKYPLTPSVWPSFSAVTVVTDGDANIGNIVKPVMQTSPPRHFKCTTGGTTNIVEPVWNTTIGGITNDGAVVWTAIQATEVDGTVGTVTDRSNLNTNLTKADD